MKRTILIYGSVAGLIVAALMIGTTMFCYHSGEFEGSMLLGYASMLLAFLFVLIGVKRFRDKENGGVITFGKALKVALLMTLVTSTLYVLLWLVDYYIFVPDFMEKYTAHVLEQAKASGMSPAALAKQQAEMAYYRELYQNPLWVILFTYMEILPVGLLMSFFTAVVMRRKKAPEMKTKI